MDERSLIKQRLDIKDIVGEYVDLKRSGRNYQGLCPFHSEKTPSFSVSSDLQIYKCFGCGESGDIFSFIQKIEGVDFRSALEKLALKANVELKEFKPDPQAQTLKVISDLNHLATKFYSYLLLNHKSGKRALDYLIKERKFKLETIKAFELGYAPDNWDSLASFLVKKKYDEKDLVQAGLVTPKKQGKGYNDKFRERVMFPLVNVSNQTVGFIGRSLDKERQPKYLNTADTALFHKGSFIYGLNKAKVALKQKGAIVVEGPADVISAYQVGIDNVIAPLGTALTANQLNLIARYTKDIIFCFDSDEAGLKAALRAINIAERMDFNIKVALIPEKYADLDEFIRKDKVMVSVMLNEAVPIYDFYITSVIRENDITSAYGKKKAMNELVQRFSTISSSVLLDYYIKEIANRLSLDQQTVSDLLHRKRNVSTFEVEPEVDPKQASTYEELLISLLVQSNIDITRDFVYNLEPRDFNNETLREIFREFKSYVEKHAEGIDFKKFLKTLDPKLQKACEDIFLKDYKVPFDDQRALIRELNMVSERIRKESARRQITELNLELQKAEIAHDFDSIQKITHNLQELSKILK